MSSSSKINVRTAFLLIGILVWGCSLVSSGGQATTTSNIPTSTATEPSFTPTPSISPSPTVVFSPSPEPTPTLTPKPSVVFAVIGDFGSGDKGEADVANLVKSWHPEFIITTGDNNYPSGSARTIDANIGQFYREFIYPYKGFYGEGADQNHFFPILGNHDWVADHAGPYLDYFSLPGNERYYDFTWGSLLHFFALDSDFSEPDGVRKSSIQAAWLKERMAESTETWKIVYMHHPPFSSGIKGSAEWMRWPFDEWHADAVIAGHDHFYERLVKRRLVYFINGLGGDDVFPFDRHHMIGSQVRFNQEHGAMRVEATSSKITFQFITIEGEVIDTYEISH